MSKKERASGPQVGAETRYTVLTDCGPIWDDIRQPQGATITGRSDNEAIAAMLERGWIEVCNNG